MNLPPVLSPIMIWVPESEHRTMVSQLPTMAPYPSVNFEWYSSTSYPGSTSSSASTTATVSGTTVGKKDVPYFINSITR